MKIAVVIPVWNRGATLSRAIDSAHSQHPDELVVVDDCSDDNSHEVAGQYPVRLVRHQEKSHNWIQALGPVYDSLTSDYVITLGADDLLYAGFLAGLRESLDASRARRWPGVVFSDYAILRQSRILETIEERRFGLPGETAMTPAEAQEWFRSRPALRFECGVGSAMRRDVLLWLYAEEYWRMGPWCDTLGSIAAACKHGCMYLPRINAGFVVQQQAASYHQEVLADDSKRQAMLTAASEWLQRPAILSVVNNMEFSL